MKNRLLLLIILLVTTFSTFAQDSKRKKISPEFIITHILPLNNMLGGYGFGLGVHNAFFNQNRCNLMIGLEYNAVFYKYSFLESDYIPQLNYVGIPVNVRVNLGKKVKFFIEVGNFFEPIIFEKRIFFEKEKPKTEKSVYMCGPDFGFSGGIGLRIPVNKYELLLKSDYKTGIRSLFHLPRTTSNGFLRFAVGFKM